MYCECSGGCTWEWDGQDWMLDSDNCINPPVYSGGPKVNQPVENLACDCGSAPVDAPEPGELESEGSNCEFMSLTSDPNNLP